MAERIWRKFFLNSPGENMNINKMYGLFLRHFYLIKSSLPRILDLIYWPTIQIILWGFISKFFQFTVIIIIILWV